MSIFYSCVFFYFFQNWTQKSTLYVFFALNSLLAKQTPHNYQLISWNIVIHKLCIINVCFQMKIIILLVEHIFRCPLWHWIQKEFINFAILIGMTWIKASHVDYGN